MHNNSIKKFTVCLLIAVGVSSVLANEFVVQSFGKIGNDISARRYERIDVNDIPCAIIKIRTDIPKPFVFDANLGVEGNVEYKENNEIWVYVSEGERQLTIAKDGFVTHKYAIPQKIEKLTVYSLVLKARDNKISVVIISTPSDAEKYIDSELLGSGTKYDIEMGQHLLEIKKNGFNTYSKNIIINEENSLFENIELSVVEPTEVTINSIPTDATIFLNNVDEGHTDKTLIKMPGVYNLRISKNKYETIEESITVTSTGPNEWSYNLLKAVGELTVTTTPSDADVSVNGELLPSKKKELAPGSYQIEARKTGWNAIVKNITMVKGVDQNVQLNLIQKTGKLELTVEPINTQVIFDRSGIILETWTGSKYKKDIPVGNYSVHLSAPGYKDERRNFEIDGINTTKLNVALNKFIYVKPRGMATARSALIPGLGQIYEGRPTMGTLYLLTELSLVYLLVDQRAEYEDLHQKYLDTRSTYTNFSGTQDQITALWNDVETAYDLSEATYKKQQITIGLIAGAYLWNIADAWLFMPKRTEIEWLGSIDTDNHTVTATVGIRLP
jgi:hypothetical protein